MKDTDYYCQRCGFPLLRRGKYCLDCKIDTMSEHGKNTKRRRRDAARLPEAQREEGQGDLTAHSRLQKG